MTAPIMQLKVGTGNSIDDAVLIMATGGSILVKKLAHSFQMRIYRTVLTFIFQFITGHLVVSNESTCRDLEAARAGGEITRDRPLRMRKLDK